METYLSYILNLLLVIAFIIDRTFRIQNLKEYKEAKEAQILALKENNELLRTTDNKFLVERLNYTIDNLKNIIEKQDFDIQTGKETSIHIDSISKLIKSDAASKISIEESLVELTKINENYSKLEVENTQAQKGIKVLTKINSNQIAIVSKHLKYLPTDFTDEYLQAFKEPLSEYMNNQKF